MGRLIDIILGTFGLTRRRVRLRNPKANWEKFITKCRACKRPGERVASFILTGNFKSAYVSDRIKDATKSAWAHALTCLHGEGGDGLQIVESQATVVKDTLLKYRNDAGYLTAFSVSLSPENFEKLKINLRSQLGKPYDIAEFLKFIGGVFDVIPNPTELHTCGVLTCYGVLGADKSMNVLHRWFGRWPALRLWPKKKNPGFVTPADLWAGMNPQYRFSRAFYNCK